MKKILLASVAGLAFLAAGNANAADLGARPMYKAPPAVAPAPVWSWTGLYFGMNVGSVWAKSRWDSTFEGDPTAEPEPVGVTYGGQVGYNWQFSNIVLGVEADFNTSGARDIAHLNGCCSDDETVESTLRSFGTVRGRLGLAFEVFGPSMIYVTGGWAWGRFHHFALDDGDEVILDVRSSESGWTVGAGFEHALFQNWTVKSEFLYIDFRRHDFAGGPDDEAIGDVFNIHDKAWVTRFGLNYKFGFDGFGKGKAPVVARY